MSEGFRTLVVMSDNKGIVSAAVKKFLLTAAFATALGAAGSAVAAADPSSSQPECTHAGVTISCPVGAVADNDGTQGAWRSGSQGVSDGDATVGNYLGCNSRQGSYSPRSSSFCGGALDDDGYQGAYSSGSTFASPQYR